MNMLKIIGIAMVLGFMMTFGTEVGTQFSIPGAQMSVSTAEARVGRPATPVSVAGVARRSVRRCAVGVYDCSLPGLQPSDILIGQAGSKTGSLEGIWQLPLIAENR